MIIYKHEDSDGDVLNVEDRGQAHRERVVIFTNGRGVYATTDQVQEMINKLDKALVKIKAEEKTAEAKKLLDEAVNAVGSDTVKKMLLGMGD